MGNVRVRHDERCGGRCELYEEDATRCAREERTRVPGRALLVALLTFAVLLVTPGRAYASGGGVIWGPSDVPGGGRAVVVNADDQFTAAAMALGYTYSDIHSWSADIKAKLSNASTGGSFYTFVQQFNRYNDAVDLDGPLGTIVEAVGSVFFAIAESLYGGNIWFAGYDSSLGLSAAYDLKMILTGQDGGGGGSSGDEIDGYTILRGGTKSGYVYTLVPMNAGDPGSYDFDTNKIAYRIAQYEQQNRTVAFGCQRVSDTACYGPVVLAYPEGLLLVKSPNGKVGIYNPTDTAKTYAGMIYERSWNYSVNADGKIELPDGGLSSFSSANVGPKQFSYLNNLSISDMTYFYCEGGTAEPVVPPTNWPDEPEAPEPPELPEPSDPVVEPPEPYEPSTGPTFIWNFTNTSEPTDTSDLLEWIKKIFYELKAIHSDLKAWFENLGSAITDGFEAMDNACGQIYGAITENTDELKSQFQSLKTYLKQLFDWLGEKMNYQASGYDDTSVIYWLKRIWSKLGNGDINVRPTDPTTDPTGVWDWLINLIQNFLIGLASSANDLISEMADLVSQVMHQFPFSIPWDIAAFLAAFAAAPITPDVDVTIPAIEGWWGETVISIDLSPYDTAAAAVRAMEKILFAAFLAWKSKDLLEFMDVTKWFNG